MSEADEEYRERLRSAAARAITEEDVRAIFQGIVERAKRGEREAIRLVLAYLSPPPAAPSAEAPRQLRAKNGARSRRVLEHRPPGEEERQR